MQLRPRQKTFVDACLQALKTYDNTIGIACTGFGKSISLGAVAGQYDRSLVLQHRIELLGQNQTKYQRVNPGRPTATFSADMKRWSSEGATFAMVQTLIGNLPRIKPVDLVIIDECFPAGSMVDGRPIESIKIGDLVNCFDHTSGRVVRRPVTHVFKNNLRGSLVTIHTVGGRQIHCTSEHPFYCVNRSKYIPAICLKSDDVMLTITPPHELPHLQSRNHQSNASSKVSSQENWASLLFDQVLAQLYRVDQRCNYGKHQQEICISAHERAQSNEQAGSAREGENVTQSNGLEANRSWWQRARTNAGSVAAFLHSWLGNGAHPSDQCGTPKRCVSQPLQTGYCKSSAEDFHRGGREHTRCARYSPERCEEDRLLAEEGVARVEVHEQTNLRELSRLCPEGVVYNLEVGEHHNYFVDGVLVHNCHHASAQSYLDILAYTKDQNPRCHVFGVTATPERADGKGLREVFTNVADVVTLAEMVQSGFLVRPRTFVIDLGLPPAAQQQLNESTRRTSRDFDMDAAAAILDIEPITDRVIEEWKRLAGDRRTIGFATNVAHSQHMAEAFRAAGVTAEHIDGTTPDGERKAILRRLDSGDTQVVWNCAVLTEGFDSPSVSCVILHRPTLHRSTMVQMVGRGLRTISEPEKYPGLIKDDCVIIDTGSSLMTHATLESEVSIDGIQKKPGDAPTKECGECGSVIPMGCMTCPICGHEFESHTKNRLVTGEFSLTEIELLKLSPYRWETLWADAVVMANALTAWAALINYKGIWFAYGGIQGQRPVQMLATSHDKIIAMVKADDFLREHGDKDAARKSKRWVDEPATEKQYEMLGEPMPIFGRHNRYRAACLITWKWNESKLRESIFAVGKQIP